MTRTNIERVWVVQVNGAKVKVPMSTVTRQKPMVQKPNKELSRKAPPTKIHREKTMSSFVIVQNNDPDFFKR